MKIGIIVNDIRTEKPGYTTTRMAMLAANRGHEVFYIDLDAFALRPDDRVQAHAWEVPVRRRRSERRFLEEVQALKARREIDLHGLDVLLPRSDPSIEIHRRPWARMAAIHFSRLARRAGVLVLNDPDGLDLGLTKLYLEYFPERIRPRTLVTRDFDEARDFIAEQGGYAVIKPLAGSGGRNVFLVRPHDTPNVNQMLEAVSRDHYFIVQEYLRDAVHGDTRVFMLNGRPFIVKGRLAALHRRRRVGDADIRSNLTAGAIATRAEVNERLLEVAEATGDRLRQDGIFFAGLDVVGDRIMEVNVQTPGGLPAAERFEKTGFTAALLDAIERKVAWARSHPGAWNNRELAVSDCT